MKTLIYTAFAMALTGQANFVEAKTSESSTEKAYISIGVDALKQLKKAHSLSIDVSPVKSIQPAGSAFQTVSIPASQIDKLSHILHEDFNRCPGYFRHDSLQKAVAFNQREAQSKQQKAIDYTIDNSDTVYSMLDKVSGENMTETVDALAAYNNRYYRSNSGKESAQWIKQKWETIAQGRDDITVQLYNHANWAQPSVIATITGTMTPDEYVITGGHLDSISGGGSILGKAPGADDNASGIAVITETLSTIVASNYKPAKTIVIMGYAAEEVGLRGSQEIAEDYLQSGKNVVGVAQFDMSGYQGSPELDIVFISDYTNNAQNQFMTQLLDTYLPEMAYGFERCGYGCSDHASWHSLGFPASFPFESNFNQSNPNIHTSGDDSYDVNHSMKFLQLSVTYLAELAKGSINGALVEGSVTFDESQVSVDEENTVTITVNRVTGQDSAISVDFTTEDGDATAGTDYTLQAGTLTWDDKDSSSKTITIATKDVSQDKTFTVKLSNPQGGALIGSKDSVTITITDKTVVTPDPIPDPTPDPTPDPQPEPTPEPAPQTSSGGAISFYWLGLLLLGGITTRRNRRVKA